MLATVGEALSRLRALQKRTEDNIPPSSGSVLDRFDLNKRRRAFLTQLKLSLLD
jgi:hypothetical protein